VNPAASWRDESLETSASMTRRTGAMKYENIEIPFSHG
jgi:hypothetical protein